MRYIVVVVFVFSFLPIFGAMKTDENGVVWIFNANRNSSHSVELGHTIESPNNEYGYMYYKDSHSEYCCYPAIKSNIYDNISVPSEIDSWSVTSIGKYGFHNCDVLVKVIIPASVRLIGDRAFYKCSRLQEAVFLGDAPDLGKEVFFGTPRSLKIVVKKGTKGWKGGCSTDLPLSWGDRSIVYDDEEVIGGDGTSQNDIRYALTDTIADRTFASIEVNSDTVIDSFVLKDGKVYDCAVRIVNNSDKAATVSLPKGYVYEKFQRTNPLVIPAASTNILTITRTKADTFLLAREELVLEREE
jgi:hypothetical protein